MSSRLFQPDILVGVDAGSHLIKVTATRARVGQPIEVLGTGSTPTPPGAFERGQVADAQALAQGIRAALAEGGIKKRKAVLTVSGQVGFIRRLSFPKMPTAEIRAAIDLQPERYIPFAQEGAVYDMHLLATEPDAAEVPVVLAAAPYRAVSGLMAAAKGAGLKPVRVDLEPLALLRAAVATGQGARESASCIVDLGLAARVSLFEGDVPVISRVVEMPAAEDGNWAASADDLFWDIRRSLEFALTRQALPLSKLLVTGGYGSDPYLLLSLAAYLRGFLANRLPEDFRVELLQDPAERVPSSHMLAFGLSLAPELFT